MKSPILNKFLCCFELQTGCFIIGTIDALLYGAVILIFSLQLFGGFEIIDRKYEYEYNGIFQLVFLYVSFFISLIFLAGIKQKSPPKVYPYLILVGCQAFVFVFIEFFIQSLVLSFLAVTRIYSFACIYSLHRNFKRMRREAETNTAQRGEIATAEELAV